MLPHPLSERAVRGFVSIERREVPANLLPESLRIAAADLVRKRFFCNLRGVDSEATSLCVKIGINGQADGLLSGLEVVRCGSLG